MRPIQKLNLILLIVALLLLVSIIRPNVAGQGSTYSLDLSEPKCQYYNNGDLTDLPLDSCCYYIQSQLSCEYIARNELKCFTIEISERFYLINSKAQDICKKEGYGAPG